MLALSIAPSGSPFLIFDVHYDATFNYMPLRYKNGLVYHRSVHKDNELDLLEGEQVKAHQLQEEERGGQTLGLGVRRGTSEGTSTARRSRGGQTLGLRVRRGIGFRGRVAQGVRYDRLGRWFGLGDETQPNEQPTLVTQQSQARIQQEPQADQEGRQAQAHRNIKRGNHKVRPRSERTMSRN
ncbi:hypothetical protein Tco_0633930 [Tanacetum coccineum]